MHALEVIIARNERAAGREAGHAMNDNNPVLVTAIFRAADQDTAYPEWKQFIAGVNAGRKDK